MMKPLLEILEYMEDPCKNCNGPVYCLDGQVVGIKRPMNGTRIAILGNTKYAGGKAQKDSLVVLHSYNTGYIYSHNTGDKYYRKIEWDSKRTTYMMLKISVSLFTSVLNGHKAINLSASVNCDFMNIVQKLILYTYLL